MSSTVASNAWAEIVHHASDGILEERWLPGQMTDGAFMASLALLALEAERLRPSAILVDATQFQYRPGPAVMEWRNNCIIPRYGGALAFRNSPYLRPPVFPTPSKQAAGRSLKVRQSFRRRGFPGGAAPSSGSRVHSAAQILKQSALVCPTVEAFKSCAAARVRKSEIQTDVKKEAAPDIGLVLASKDERA